VGVVSVVASWSCAPPGPDIAVHSAVQPLEGPCPVDGLRSELAEEVSRLRLTITAPDMDAPIAVEGDVGRPISADEVPVGDGRVVALFGLSGNGATWRGVSRGISVVRDRETKVDVLMARIADLSCTRSGDDVKRAFHSATTLRDGRILVVGGGTSTSACAGDCLRYAATDSASLYDPRTGTFSRTGRLAVPRMFHTATLLDDGRVVIVGGAREIEIHGPGDAAFPFPIAPGAGADPTGGIVEQIEIYDPKSGRFSPAGDDPGGPRVFAAAATLPSGEVLVSGGIPSVGSPRHDLSNAMRSTTICGGAPLVCRAGPPMASRRAGHMAFRVDDDVVLWGGAIDAAVVGGEEIPQLEVMRGAELAFLNVARMSRERNLFFAAAAQYLPFRVLAAGGLVRAGDGTFALATTDVDGATRGAVYIFDAAHREGDFEGGIAVGPIGGERMHLQAPRFLAASAALPGASRAVIAGGFSSLSLTPSDGLELFDEEEVVVRPISAGGAPRLLRQARGGLAAATNGDGNVLFVGGEGGGTALQTGEIFADPQNPPGVVP
jgi:hypothetical protein